MNELTIISPEQLIARAIEAQVPVEALERLLAMRAELKREQARGAFFTSLAAFQANIPAIPKAKVATVQTARGSYAYRYADIADIQRAIAPVLNSQGLSVTFDTRHTEGEYLITCIVHHIEGHSERSEFLVPIDAQARMNDAQKAGSALTYGRRYALCAALGIVTAEEDDDAQGCSSAPKVGAQPDPRPPQPPAATPTGSAPPVRPNGAPSPEGADFLPRPPAAQPPTLITPAQHRRLEALLREADLPRERIRDWTARRYPHAYPNGVHLDQLWATHAAEIERRIPEFVAALAEAERKANAQQTAALAEEREALAWARAEYGWQGDITALEALATNAALQASQATQYANAKDGALNARDLEHAHQLSQRSSKLKAALRGATHNITASQPN